mmetsp:Transcript_13826/g.26550  ORF Transcript_13826/g.26550 Transcript_13826/m.26550 type:complete len:326 (+) Transcript_13826:210-1187(+)
MPRWVPPPLYLPSFFMLLYSDIYDLVVVVVVVVSFVFVLFVRWRVGRLLVHINSILLVLSLHVELHPDLLPSVSIRLPPRVFRFLLLLLQDLLLLIQPVREDLGRHLRLLLHQRSRFLYSILEGPTSNIRQLSLEQLLDPNLGLHVDLLLLFYFHLLLLLLLHIWFLLHRLEQELHLSFRFFLCSLLRLPCLLRRERLVCLRVRVHGGVHVVDPLLHFTAFVLILQPKGFVLQVLLAFLRLFLLACLLGLTATAFVLTHRGINVSTYQRRKKQTNKSLPYPTLTWPSFTLLLGLNTNNLTRPRTTTWWCVCVCVFPLCLLIAVCM